ncbi:MAG: hypothetical protein LLG01_08115 [Planctomycetaceae bacterium]|nr:hypothetical protein [Planctomycetaceae bacterium]
MNMRNGLVALSVIVLLAACGFADVPKVPPPVGAPLAAKWEYSRDGGKTFSPEAPAVTVTSGPDAKNALVARATFSIDDMAKIGAVKIVTASGTGAFALTDADSVQRRYVGAYPTLVNARLAVNGKETDAGHFPSRLYNYLTIDPDLLHKGANTLTVAAVLWAPPTVKTDAPAGLSLETLGTDMVSLDRGPTLGAIGEDYFTFTARAVTACDFSVSVKPIEPAGAETQQALPKARLLRAKVALAKGTKKFAYTLTAKSAGGATKAYGPYEVVVPVFGEGFKFVAAANTYIYGHHPEELKAFFAKLPSSGGQIFVHGGVMQNVATHDQMWTNDFFYYSREALARMPMYAVPGYPDTYSMEAWGSEFYFPTPDGTWNYWTQAFGKVRLIGIEAMSMMEDKGAGKAWLEDVLKNAKEDYVIVFNSQAPNCSGQNAKYYSKPAVEYIAKEISPLLVKYKVTATIGSYHYSYQRNEPPADESVTTIMTSKAGGLGWPLRTDFVAANKESKVAVGYKNHYCLFEVTKDALQMQAIAYETGEVIDKVTFKPRAK